MIEAYLAEVIDRAMAPIDQLPDEPTRADASAMVRSVLALCPPPDGIDRDEATLVILQVGMAALDLRGRELT